MLSLVYINVIAVMLDWYQCRGLLWEYIILAFAGVKKKLRGLKMFVLIH